MTKDSVQGKKKIKNITFCYVSTLQHPTYAATQNNLFKHISEPVPDNPGGVSTAALHIQQKATKKKKKGKKWVVCLLLGTIG